MSVYSQKQRLRLLPDHDIYVTAVAADGRRFVALFRLAWRQLPYRDRRLLLDYWRREGTIYPIVTLSETWRDSEHCHGQGQNYGHELRVSSNSFEFLPQEVARFVIAHELAHVYQKACGRQPGGTDEQENEDDADRIAREWGFDNAVLMGIDLLVSGGCPFPAACERWRFNDAR